MKKNFDFVKYFFAFLIFFFVSSQLMAIPADTTMKSKRQSDNRLLDFYLIGDEFVNFARSIDNYTLLLNENGDYCYAYLNENGDLVASSYLASNPNQRTKTEIDFLSSINKRLTFSDNQITNRKSAFQKIETNYPTTGNNNLLILLVSFADRAFTYTREDFDSLASQPGYSRNGATGSVKDYYYDVSFGQLELNPTVAGPYTLSQPMAYYGAAGPYFSDVNPKEMVSEACALADSEIDFSQFDMNNDGKIDAVHVIFAGAGEASTGETNAIWPHRWSIYPYDSLDITFDGVTLRDYSCSAEKMGSGMDGIGTICHEFGHVLGLPDLYDTDYEGSGGQATAVNTWSIMASGSYNNYSNTPASFTAYEKYRLNWLDFDTLSLAGEYVLPPLMDSNKAYIITTPYENEFFVFENRNQSSWDTYVPNSGGLIFHIKREGDYNINCDPNYQKYDIEEADRNDDENTLATDVFPSAQYNDFFADYSQPNSILWSGESLNKPITRITRDTSDNCIRFRFMIPDSSAIVETIHESIKLSNTSYQVKGIEVYAGIYNYVFKGFALDTLQDFSTKQFFEANEFNADSFSTVLTNLLYAKTYYYRSVYISDYDTVYGQIKTFTTVDGQPILKTNSATNIDLTSMIVGGGVLVEGDFPILEYGICYSTTQNPDTTTNVISFVGECETFTTQITGLEQATKYYFRTYAITALGIKYASQKSATTDFIPIENNVITGGATLCEGADFGMILGSQPQAGQGNFTYQWQRKEEGRSWEDIEENGNGKDYIVGTLTTTTSFRRVVFSFAIRNESNVVEMKVLKSKGGKIEGKTEWISSEEDTLTLKSFKGEILSWQEANQDFNWHTIANSQQDTNLLYNPNLLDTVYLRAVVQLNECPIAYSDTLKINVVQDVSLEEIVNGEMYFVYPNPSKGQSILNNPTQQSLFLTIFDSNAREIISFSSSDSQINLPIQGLQSGIYFLRIENKQDKKQVKEIKIILMN
ncbi:MAG: M6 family metalloprotease domain-containing protein [Bacteroidales bacterium]|nr:M6 family metalloprotease domain-containing protein [Bacteroidales bacterium]